MKIMYPLTVQQDYIELRYSLRSVEKYLPSYEVVIVGDYMPEWLTGVTQIELPDVPGRKQLSIKRKILTALEYSDEIIFMNDDVYLLQEHTFFPYYYSGTLKSISESGAKPLMKQLEKMNKPVNNYDGHYPLVYKKGFNEAFTALTEDCIIKSAYCNYLEVTGIEFADCKLIKAMKPEKIKEFIKDKPCFSTGSYSLKSALPVLQELFPNKSKHEI